VIFTEQAGIIGEVDILETKKGVKRLARKVARLEPFVCVKG